MISWPFPKLLGNKNERELGRLRPIVSRIREIEGALEREPAEKLLELTRGIELYNYRVGTARTGQYRVQPGTEDGFAPGP